MPTLPVPKSVFKLFPPKLDLRWLREQRRNVPNWVWVVSMLFVILMVGTITLGSSVVINNLQGSGTPSPTLTLRILISNTGSTSPTPFPPITGTQQVNPPFGQDSETNRVTEENANLPTDTLPPQSSDTPEPQPTEQAFQPTATRSIPTATRELATSTSAPPPTLAPSPTRGEPISTPTEPPEEPTPEPPTPTAPP